MSDVMLGKDHGEQDDYRELCIREASVDTPQDDTYLELCTREASVDMPQDDTYLELCTREASVDMPQDDTYLELSTLESEASDSVVAASLRMWIPATTEIYDNDTKGGQEAVPEVTCFNESKGDSSHHLEESAMHQHEACPQCPEVTGSGSHHAEDMQPCLGDSLVSIPLTTADGSTHSIPLGDRNTRRLRPSRKTIRKLLMVGIRVTFVLWCITLIAYIGILLFRPKFIMEMSITVAVVDVTLTSLNIAFDKVCRQTSAYVSYVVLLVLTIYISSIYGVLAYHKISETFMVIASVAYVGALILCGVFTHVRVYLVYKSESGSGNQTWLRWING